MIDYANPCVGYILRSAIWKLAEEQITIIDLRKGNICWNKTKKIPLQYTHLNIA